MFFWLLWAGRSVVSDTEDGESKAAVRQNSVVVQALESGRRVEAQCHRDLAVSPGQRP